MVSIRKRLQVVRRAFVPPPDKNATASCVTLGKRKSLSMPSINGVFLEPAGLSTSSFLAFEFPISEQQEDSAVDNNPKAVTDFVFSSARKEVNTQTLHEKRNQEMAQVRADDTAEAISDHKRKNEAAEVGANATEEELLALKAAHALDLYGASTTLPSVPCGPFVQQEKHKIKIKEKLEKCVEEKLMEFCDVLGIPIANANKKEDIIIELVNFFVEPAATTTELFAEKEQSCKGTKCKIGDSIFTSLKTFARKNIPDNGKEKMAEKATTLKKPSSWERSGRKVVKGKDKPEKENIKPSDAELSKTISRILVEEVDINTATFSDILQKLAGRYKSDLTPRKSSIKLIIRDELIKFAELMEADDMIKSKKKARLRKKRHVIR